MKIQNEVLSVCAQVDGGLNVASSLSDALQIGPLLPALTVDGNALTATSCTAKQNENATLEVVTEYSQPALRLTQRWEIVDETALRLKSELCNLSEKPITLNAVQLLEADASRGAGVLLARDAASLQLYEQAHYWARVRHLGGVMARAQSEDPSQQFGEKGFSQNCWMSYDAASRAAFLVGFETTQRWAGEIRTSADENEKLIGWSIGFDGGDVVIEAGETVALEDVLFLAGRDPLTLLEAYGDLIARRHNVGVLPASPVSWCSWYAYRLSQTQERTLANAQIAAQRLKPLGLEFIVLDLGWELDQLPSTFEANDQFSNGLKWLSQELEQLGFSLGVWKGPVGISALDPVASEHPEWLLGGKDEYGNICKPMALGEWFWEPHGETHGLDLTHPQAQEWLRMKMRSLAERGVKYFKPDFLGVILGAQLRERYDNRIVAGGGTEAARIALAIIMEELRAGDPHALSVNCGGPEMPGKGQFPLLYSCIDTGNSGYIDWTFARDNFGQTIAGHLWKQGRWGTIQPSCLCVGLPGTLEEARLRATVAFLCGGQIDISDDLTVLPEDRWQILEATLPPLSTPARPIDLFDPITVTSLSYEAMCRGANTDDVEAAPLAPTSRVWHLPVKADWDEWHLIGLFNYERPAKDESGSGNLITCFQLPLQRFGLNENEKYWVHEFWSSQFLGETPAHRNNPRGYVHPGDAATLIASRTPENLDVSFFGPSVKLLVVRKAKPHPWPVATSFHQSGGTELQNVEWHAESGVLRGELNRPAAQQGFIVIAGCDFDSARATVGGREVPLRRGASGAVLLPMFTEAGSTPWEIRCEKVAS